MAKQDGHIRVTGTYEDYTFYQMHGRFYLRQKSNLTKKKFWKSPKFEGSRRSCLRFKEGNILAGKVYRRLPLEKRKYEIFCRLKSMAILFFKQGLKEELVREILEDYTKRFHVLPHPRKEKRKTKNPLPYATSIHKDYAHYKIGHIMRWVKEIGECEVIRRVESFFHDGTLFYPPDCYWQRARA